MDALLALQSVYGLSSYVLYIMAVATTFVLYTLKTNFE